MKTSLNMKLPLAATLLVVPALAYSQAVDESETDVYELDAITVSPLEELANRAIFGETPVAFSELSKDDLDRYLASQEIPMALNYSPSVYATNQGGGAGDARINVRGFNQRNVAVMINGVPVNDMENGWVYWSNWDGIGDVASSIQLQRGTSNLNLAVPSIGGTLNILTDPAAKEAGGLIKQEFGTDSFSKTTVVGHTGLINDKFAASAAVVRKVGDSYIDGVWTDAWAWYVGGSFKANERNTFEVYALSAPQRHGQNLYKGNIAEASHDFASSLSDYDQAAFSKYEELGYAYNETWGPVSESYTGLQNYKGSTHPRRFSDYLNFRENYYDKPQVSVNWYFDPDSNWKWDNILYYSGGEGGGAGTYGRITTNYDSTSEYYKLPDWDATIAKNEANLDANGEAESTAILRNSVNEQWTVGALSKVTFEASENWKTSAGFDWRTAEIVHRYEVRDLLGGDYYTWNGVKKRLGDAFNYNNTNTVDWLGGFLQTTYDQDAWSGFAMLGYSQIKYDYTDHFDVDSSGNKFTIASDWIEGYQIKTGGRYDFNENFSAFANAGYVEKVPIFDNVIDDYNGVLTSDPRNEKFTNFEAGVNWHNQDGTFNLVANVYHTKWEDRAFSKYVAAYEDYVNLSGVNQTHQGIEVEGAYYFSKSLRIDASLSLNDWTYDNEVTALYTPEDASGTSITYKLYLEGLKVGDAPQTQLSASVVYMPTSDLTFTFRGRHNRDFYADFDPISRTDSTDTTQSWRIPDYEVFDFHAQWDLPVDGDIQYQIFANVTNLFDETYIQDATDNDYYEAWDMDHDADDASVFFGAPRRINAGIKIAF